MRVFQPRGTTESEKGRPQTHTTLLLYRFLPMMVSRLIFSLRKVASPIYVEWRGNRFSRFEAMDTYGSNLRMGFVRNLSAEKESGVPSTSQV